MEQRINIEQESIVKDLKGLKKFSSEQLEDYELLGMTKKEWRDTANVFTHAGYLRWKEEELVAATFDIVGNISDYVKLMKLVEELNRTRKQIALLNE